MKDMVMDVVRKSFRPEFINRIDESVVFHALNKENIIKIAKVQIQKITHRLQELNYKITLSEDALDYIAKTGFDPVYGARPLKRAIQQLLENPLSQDMVSGKFAPGDVIHVKCVNENLVFSR